MAYSKVTLNNTTLMDVTQDTVTPERLAENDIATAADGQKIVGTMAVSRQTGSITPAASTTTFHTTTIVEKIGKIVHVYLRFASSVNISTTGQTIATLSDGFRPNATQIISAYCQADGLCIPINFEYTGNLIVFPGTSFAANVYYFVNATFFAD